ncbi:putative Serine peptidase [Pleurostoma richardsiae]|uniref:Serine peptidase n=1 Tax=Pleurostoma richardsiae TaxID=41990 RepID=A0AA38VXT2_9PEZI|nr:putative Serine peptidase [Pleurostoma richardsiae]
MKCSYALLSALVGSTTATFPGLHGRMVPPPLTDDRDGLQKRSTTGSGVFQQLIDHSNPDLGTFSQRFWWNDEFYAGPGSPVVFFTPGEENAAAYTGYLNNKTITGAFGQAIGGAVVIMEHRYWGTSSPYEELTTENLQYLTLPQSIADTTYFARNVQLPFDMDGTSRPDKAPWVFSGGSYSGALSGWVESVDPGTFWAYHASSAVVETVADFWQYFYPVQQGMPKNCSTDLSKVINYVDKILMSDDETRKQKLKEKFGLGDVVHDDDFASVLQSGPWQWQTIDFRSGYSGFYKFCDYIENAYEPAFLNSTVIPGEEGVGLCKALNGFAKWTKEVMFPGACEGYGYWTGEYNAACFDTYNASNPFYTDLSLDNAAGRQWMWYLCNEPLEFWQDGAPAGVPSIVSRLINPAYWERQCGLFFPEEDGYTYGIAKGKDVTDVNAYTRGWFNTNSTRLIWTNGEFDPWREGTVSSDFRPGGPFIGTPEAPVQVIPGGIHCFDLIMANGAANSGVQAVIDNEIAIVKGWVEEFYSRR